MATNNPPPFDDEGDVREGFLCPLCKKDLQSFHQLQSHYEDEHSIEDRDVKGQLKSLVRKAKIKFLKREGEERTDAGSQDRYEAYSYGGVDPYMWDPQEIGATKSHLADFKKHRAARIDHYVIEVNRLIIRLEKLASFDRTNTDSAKIRAIEKSVVPWVSDHDVPFCPDCGNKFSIRNRRHHCRLCGSIMCKKCMEVVGLPLANKLTNANKQALASHGSPNLSPNNSAHTSRRGSISSLSSVSSILDEKDDDRIRCCRHCKGTLLKREEQIDEREFTPDIVKFYKKLRLCMSKVDLKAPEYIKMAQSINAGEDTYNLDHANDLRVEVQKMYEIIDALSKKILTLGMNEEPKPSPKTLQLQKMIRYSATLFVQEKLLGLMSLPTKEQYEQLKEKRKQEIEQKLHLERKAALEAQRRTEEKGKDFVSRLSGAPNGDVPVQQKGRVRKAEGWLPTFSTPRDSRISDPLLQQIQNITSFIEQAKEANRSDEVQMLQENLRQLQDEYDQQQVEMAIELSKRMAEEEAMQREQFEVLREKEWEREQNKNMSQQASTHSLDLRDERPFQNDNNREKSNLISHALDLDTMLMKHSSKLTSPSLDVVQQPPNRGGPILTYTEDSLLEPNKGSPLNPFSENGGSTPINLSNPFAEDIALAASAAVASSDPHSANRDYNPFEDDDETDLPAHKPSNGTVNPFEEVQNPFREHLEDSSNPFEESTPPNPFEEDDDNVGEEIIEEDLLLQQIDNIKAYIFDAKHSGRLDEVELLTENLKDLKRKLAEQKGVCQ